MVQTIFPRYAVSREDQSLLLNLVTILSLQDLMGAGSLEWKKFPDSATLVLRRDHAAVQAGKLQGWSLKPKHSDQDLRRIAETAEQVMDRYILPEAERAALFTALPCLGLHALQEYLTWKNSPPFLELG